MPAPTEREAALPPAAAVEAAPVAEAPRIAEAAPVAEAPPVAEAMPVAAPPRAERRPEAPAPRRAIPDLPPVTLELPPESGLVLVETSHRAETAPEAEPSLPAGPRRARRPRSQLVDEPLQIVETRKDAPPAA